MIVNTTRFFVPSGAFELTLHPHYQFEIRKTKMQQKENEKNEKQQQQQLTGQQIPLMVNGQYVAASLDNTNTITIPQSNLPLIPGNVALELPTIDIHKKKDAPIDAAAPIFSVVIPEWQVHYRQYIKEPTYPF